MAVYRQNSFAGGMLSPSLEGRTDYEKRLSGARVIRNFFVTPYGTLRRRPGIRFVANTAGDKSRLITYRGQDNVDTLLVLTDRSCTAYRGGATTGAVTFTTGWRGEHLNSDPTDGTKPGIKWSQSGNRILVTHPEYQPQYIIAPDATGGWRVNAGDTLEEPPDVSTFTARYVGG